MHSPTVSINGNIIHRIKPWCQRATYMKVLGPPNVFPSPAGIRAVFSGHYHRNAGGTYQDLDMVVSSAIGCQLGKDTHGLRVVVVTAENIVHRYYSLDELSRRGIDDDLKELMKE